MTSTISVINVGNIAPCLVFPSRFSYCTFTKNRVGSTEKKLAFDELIVGMIHNKHIKYGEKKLISTADRDVCIRRKLTLRLMKNQDKCFCQNSRH